MRQGTTRGKVAKLIIAVAVLAPAALIVVVALHSRLMVSGLRVSSLTPWFVADACLLGLGLLLHRGEEL